MTTTREIDPEFRALPHQAWADAALSRGSALGAEHVTLRVHRLTSSSVSVHDSDVEHSSTDDELGVSVRVVHDGAWGFAASDVLGTDSVVALVDRAVQLAKATAPLATQRVVLTPEPAYGWVEYLSAYEIDPLSVPLDATAELLLARTAALLRHPSVEHADADVEAVKEATFVATSDGTFALQQRVRIHPTATVVGSESGRFELLRTLAPPTGRGWEYLNGVGWDWAAELGELPELLAQKLVAPSVEPGRYDLLIDATNLWLTIHESVGHATELDRSLGDEANYAGTSFVLPSMVNELTYGSEHMNVVADRTEPHGLGTVGWDDEGVAAQRWDLITDGTLRSFQMDRSSAVRDGHARSNGCAYADSAAHIPIQRMANVGLQPAPLGPDLEGLVAELGDGIMVVGDGSWSIDMQRYNFQFTGQRFHQIRSGEVVGQVRDVVYQGRTPDFWASMSTVGGADTVKLMGAFNCGKGQPGQVAPVSHSTPSAIFRQVNVLNANAEGTGGEA